MQRQQTMDITGLQYYRLSLVMASMYNCCILGTFGTPQHISPYDLLQYPEKTTVLPQVTDKLDHIILYQVQNVYCLHLISCYTSYRGIFFLFFAYFHLRSCRSKDAGHVPLTTCFVYITYFLEMLAFQISFCHFIIYNNKSQLLLHPYMASHLIYLENQLRYHLLNM